MKWTCLILGVLLLSCASANFNHGAPHKQTERWKQEHARFSYGKCEYEKVLLAYVRMSMYHGCSECTLYFHRCRYLVCEVERTDAAYGKTIKRRICKLPKLKELEDFLDKSS